jgi:hypothetical protein
LPIWPLDGGKISREVFQWIMPARGAQASLGLSLVVAGVIAANSLAAYSGKPLIPNLYAGGLYTAVFFAMFALSNFQELQMTPSRPRPYSDNRGAPWERDPDYWKNR